MNRLIIIGNGFDLAHGLPTRYKDFIEDYLCSCINYFFKDDTYDDLLISINYTNHYNRYQDKSDVTNYDDAIQLLNDFKEREYIHVEYKSHFFSGLIENLNNVNWVDVENDYFTSLNGCKNRPGPDGDFYFEAVEYLNLEFEYLKDLLEKYLIKVVKNNIQAINPNKYSKVFSDFIFKKEVLLKELEGDILPNNIHVLNFNYTSFVESTLDNIKDIPVDINYIHGMLNYDENPIIFGFGDEYDKNYKGFEDQKNNCLFEHIKSFGYFKTTNYHDLIRFLESDDYQVYIVGHSCGLSDRTMLKEIFENEKCKSIKIFYHDKGKDKNDYTEKTMEISRHFEDKGLMRKKIVPFPLCKKM